MDSVPSSSNSFHEIKEISNLHNDKSDVNEYSMANIVLKANDIINFDMKSLLNSHIVGRALLIKYEKGLSIDNKDRNNLCDIIICHFLNEGKRLNNTSISVLANKIVEIFREETKSTYYVSHIGKKKSR